MLQLLCTTVIVLGGERGGEAETDGKTEHISYTKSLECCIN